MLSLISLTYDLMDLYYIMHLSFFRTSVLPPLSLYDMVNKMRSGYYDVNTDIVRESYRVVTPSLSNIKELGYYIGRECANYPSYKLERIESPGTCKQASATV